MAFFATLLLAILAAAPSIAASMQEVPTDSCSKTGEAGCNGNGISGFVSFLQTNSWKSQTRMQTSPRGNESASGAKLSCSGGPFKGHALRLSYNATEEAFANTSRFVRKNGLTFLPSKALEMHKELIEDIELRGVPGVMVETGVAAGGSAMIFTLVKRKERCLHLYDTFQGIPPPSDKDDKDVHRRYEDIQAGKAGKNYYGYNPNLLGFVKDRFVEAGYPSEENGVVFHKGLFNETFNPDFEIAYAHLDGDWYESTYVVLARATPRLALNGIMVLDDYGGWSGATKAFNEFFALNASHGAYLKGLSRSKDGKTFQMNFGQRLYVRRTA